MSLQRQHFLLSYLKTLSVGPAGVRTHDLPHGSPVLNQLSQPVGGHPEHLNNISVIPSGMSDHLPIVATRKYNRTRSNNSRYNAISYRDIKNLDKDAFVESLETAPWDCAFVFDDINDIVDAWYKILKAVVNEHLPLKQKRVNAEINPSGSMPIF